MRHVAFLRAINTGQRRVKNPQLSEVVRRLGASFAEGFLASGNVVFDLPVDAGFVERLEAAYEEAFGFDVPVMLRTDAQTTAAAHLEPFSSRDLAASQGRIFVGLVKVPPSASMIRQVEDMATATDRLRVVNGDIYWQPQGGDYQSELSVPSLEAIVGPMTVRAQTTLKRLTDKYLGLTG